MRSFHAFAAAALVASVIAAPATAAPFVYYGLNGPQVQVPLATDKPEWAKPGVDLVTFQPSTVAQERTEPFAWTFFPASKGTVTMQVRRLDANGRLQWVIGVTPAVDAANPPAYLALQGWPQLGLTLSRVYAGEATLPVTQFRTEQNQQTKEHQLIFTFVTPLEKGKTAWFRVGTYSTSAQAGGFVTFSDNKEGSPWPRFPFLRNAATRLAPPASADSQAYRDNPPSSGMNWPLRIKLPSLPAKRP